MPTNRTNCPLKLQFGLINHESCYLTAEAFGFKVRYDGKVTCEAEVQNRDCRFLIAAQSDGRLALQSEPYLRFFEGSCDYLFCFTQVMTERYTHLRYLVNDGKLSVESGRGTGYTLELKCGKLAFKDCEGKYLSPMGPTGTLRSGRCSKPGKDELFDLEESHPQVVLMAANSKYVSIRQGKTYTTYTVEETQYEHVHHTHINKQYTPLTWSFCF
uniref:Fascin actin-bundling protein 2b, retinal n=1 Tax=Oncorhynchus kisutch TaxID=8019 RepID=A0A8C7D359_ONCKI